MEINRTQETLLGILSQVLTGTEYTIPADTDWAALYAESKAQAVLPMVFSHISALCTDKEVFDRWKAVTIRSLQKNRKVQVQHGQLHQLLTEHSIPYVIIKGCASARDYPDPLLRAMGDVDFLVSKDHWNRAKEILLQAGFEAYGEDHAFHLSFCKKGFEMEMHHEPFGLKGEKAEALLELVPGLVENGSLVTCDDITFRMSDPFGHGIVLLLHAYRHLINSGVGVRHLCDWAAFISGFSGDEFDRIFRERFQALGIWKLTQVFSATCHRYLGIPYQPWMGKIDETECKMLMMDIFNGGNFGQGSGERLTQNMSLYNEDQLAEGGSFLQMVRGLNRTALTRYPRLMKIKIFRPFGWMILGVRYVFRVLTGKRKKAPNDTMQVVSMRKKLYQQLAVFETSD